MEAILEWLAAFGAGLASAILLMGIFVGAIMVGLKIAKIKDSSIWGWATGIATFLLLSVLFYPSIEALNAESCKNAEDFEDCMDGPEDY